MKTKLIALLCLCAVVAFAATQSANLVASQKDQEKVGIPRAGQPYAVPEGYPNHGARDGRAILISEDFEAGMPGDWTVIDGNGDYYTWTTGTTADLWGYDPPAYGGAYAYYSDDDAYLTAPAGTEYLISPAKDCAGLANLILSYGWGFYIYDTPYGAAYVRVHDGASWGAWNLLATYYVDGNGVDTFYLAAYLPADSIQVQFTYEDPYAGWGWAMGIDNVILIQPAEYDAGCNDVVSPPDGSIPYGSYDVIGNVENFGQYTETFDVTADVYDTDGMVNIFSQTQSVTLAAGANTDVNFGSVYLDNEKYFYVEIYTELSGDEEASNDTATAEPRTAIGLGDVVYELDVESIVGDNQLLGVEFDGEYFYVSGGNSGVDPNKIYVLDTLGTLVYTIDQPWFATGWGYGCLAWDGAVGGARLDTLYGVTVYSNYVDKLGIDKATWGLNYYSSFPVPAYYSLGLCYDDDTDEFFGGNFFSSYGASKFRRDGVLTGYTATTYALFGAAYDTDDDEGGTVYWFSQDDPGTGDLCQFNLMDANTMAWLGYIPNAPVVTVSTAPIAGGCCFYEGFRGMDVIFGLVQGTPDAIFGMFVRYDVPLAAATIDFDPDKLNLKSKGRFITCFIELEEGYYVEDIDMSTLAIIEINGTAIDPIYAPLNPAEVGDYDYDGIPDLKVKFGRGALLAALEELEVFGYADCTVRGELTDVGNFEGVGRITLLHETSAYNGRQGYTGIPRSFALHEGQPNPFNTSTMITYAVPQATGVTLQIYDASGRMVKQLVDDVVAPGYYNVRWDAKDDAGKDVASGVYFLKFDAGSYKADSKLLLVK